MVSTRRQSGVIPKPSSALKRSLDYLDDEPSSEDDYQEPKAQRAKRRKTANTAAGKTKAVAKHGRRGRDLSLLPTMPFDVLYEILRMLGPKDLLSISRINIAWRKMVVSPETEFLWRGARKEYGAPEPPEDFTEQRWAGLLFETTCECCGKKGITSVDWLLLRRVCNDCKRNHLMYGPRFKSTFPGQDKNVLNYVPHTFTGVTTRHSKYSYNPSRFYWDEDVQLALEEIEGLSEGELQGWKAAMELLIENRDEMVDIYRNWERHLDTLAVAEARANREARLKAVRERFLEAGYELVDICSAISPCSDGIYSGVPYITNAVWTKIRPSLEEQVIIGRNRRLHLELSTTVENRMNILQGLYDSYLDRTTLPSERYYCPPASVFRPIPEVLAIVEADKGTVVTAKDFKPIVDSFGRYLADNHEKKKRSFKDLVPRVEGADAAEKPFDLARHVFRRHSSDRRSWAAHGSRDDEVLVGWPMLGTHWYQYPSYLGIRPGVAVAVDADFAYNSDSSKVSSSLIRLADLDPETTPVVEMDAKDPRFVLGNFYTAIGYPVFTWRAALGIVHVLQHKYWAMDGCEFRLATAEEEAEAKQNEETIRTSAQAWACNHCIQFLRADEAADQGVVVAHLHTRHGITDPKLGRDFFVNERCRHEFERPYEILVPDVEKWKCSCWHCDRVGYRRFTKEGVMEHVKLAFPYDTPREGIHYLAVASGSEALGVDSGS